MSIQSDFVTKYKTYADTAAQGIGGGITSSDILGQWAQETGWGKEINGQNNLGGIKPGNKLANYETLDDFVSHYVYVMKQDLGLGNTFLDKLSNGVYEGYNNPQGNEIYAQDVGKNILSLQNIVQAVTPAPSTAPTGGKNFFQKVKDWLDKNAPKPDKLIITNTTTGKTTQDANPSSGDTSPGGIVGGIKSLTDIPQALNNFALTVGGILTGLLLAIMGIWLIIKSQSKEDKTNVD